MPSRKGGRLDPIAVSCLGVAALIGIGAAVLLGTAESLPLTMAVAGAGGGVVIAVYTLVFDAERREAGSWMMLTVYALLGAFLLYLLGLVIWFATRVL